MVIRTDPHRGNFYCEPLSCWLSRGACAGRFTQAQLGDRRFVGGPCGARCNVGRAVDRGEPLPETFAVVAIEEVKTVASRDKNWGHAICQQCGERFKKGSGNHLYFCKRRCAKRFYRPYRPPAPGLGALEAIMEGY